jgi:hypothetical protein
MEKEDSDRTVYSIRDEYGEKSSITLDKFTADTLQKYLPNVHEWVQKTYSRVAKKKPELGRREKGDLVRALALREAAQQLQSHGEFDDF